MRSEGILQLVAQVLDFARDEALGAVEDELEVPLRVVEQGVARGDEHGEEVGLGEVELGLDVRDGFRRRRRRRRVKRGVTLVVEHGVALVVEDGLAVVVGFRVGVPVAFRVAFRG